jgi:hypothetical protein
MMPRFGCMLHLSCRHLSFRWLFVGVILSFCCPGVFVLFLFCPLSVFLAAWPFVGRTLSLRYPILPTASFCPLSGNVRTSVRKLEKNLLPIP